MKQQEAEKVLNDTFNHEFDLGRFGSFIKELFKGKCHINLNSKSLFPYKQFDEGIKSFKQIGEYDAGRNSLIILAVELKKTDSLEKARTMQRNFVGTWLLKGGSVPRDGALVAFYGDNPNEWRFSFVKMDYKFDENGKAIKELTPAKRLSYLVGKHEPNHTCKKQFLGLLMEEKTSPSFQEIESAFGVENVTKEFFELYKQRFFELRDSLDKIIENSPKIKKDFELKQINSTEFAKKLLGQIVFLYFLQKKGWLGLKKEDDGSFKDWGEGNKNFMTRLFNKEIVNYNNFFDEILEPLFYEALNKERDDNYFSRLNCKIPFLNGGLFEPIKEYDWVNTKIEIDNDIFRKILIETFDKFNFTIKEDEPLEREVAVDPEMLGKVFENLLDVNDRKSKGAFYTPREIVHYMCQQSLINYLETNTKIPREDLEKFILKGDLALDYLRRVTESYRNDVSEEFMLPSSISKNTYIIEELLKRIKICDPAVGSGAFPVGMMNEIVRARQILRYFIGANDGKLKTDYDLKRETIENCLYGVDIEPSAVDITKLRFWLSLIVDENDMQNIKPLPNLDNRIMCGNSLIEEFEGVKLFDESILFGTPKEKKEKQSNLDKFVQEKRVQSQIKFEKLRQLQKEYFNEQNGTKKKQLMNEIQNLEWDFIEATLKEQNNEEALKKLEQYKTSKSKPFFLWKLYFSDVFQRENPGFDVVIGNPPYVGEKGHKEIFRLIAETEFGKKFYQGKMDLFYFFFHKGLDVSRKSAQVSFITTNYYSTALGAKKLRLDLRERAIVRHLINFNELRIFESALGQHNMITILSKGNNKDFVSINCITSRTGDANPKILSDILSLKDKETKYYSVRQEDIYEGDENYIRLNGILNNSESPIIRVLTKMKSSGRLLGSICDINNGVHTEADYLSNKKFNLREDLSSEIGDGIYVLNTNNLKDLEIINKITSDEIEKNYLKPFFKNSDVKKYYSNINNTKYLIYINKQKDDISQLPIISNQLKRFKKILDSSSDNAPYLHRPKKEYIFKEEKIIVSQRSKENSFGYNNCPWFSSADVYFITKNNHSPSLKFILSVLNSKLIYIWLYNRGKRKGETLELYTIPLSEIPIKVPEEQKPFIEIVDKILNITKDEDYLKNPEKQAKVKAYEKQIDKLVYELYELTPEEIKIVEEFGK